jgi:6-pyruvoyltetrahydropterin/6-carboxytetrahydropterin synthase
VNERVVTITHRYEWDMAHRIPEHAGKCRRLHGHRYILEVDVTGWVQSSGPADGMVVDFGDVKDLVKRWLGHWDHRTMLAESDPLCAVWDESKPVTESGVCAGDVCDEHFGIFRVPFIPTAENIALEVYRILSQHLNITRVRIYETPNGWAEVHGGDIYPRIEDKD